MEGSIGQWKDSGTANGEIPITGERKLFSSLLKLNVTKRFSLAALTTLVSGYLHNRSSPSKCSPAVVGGPSYLILKNMVAS